MIFNLYCKLYIISYLPCSVSGYGSTYFEVRTKIKEIAHDYYWSDDFLRGPGNMRLRSSNLGIDDDTGYRAMLLPNHFSFLAFSF